jgi:hypothetical protein
MFNVILNKEIKMKTEIEIEARLMVVKEELKAVRAQFEEYDNYEDMEKISILGQEIKTLEWALNYTSKHV